MGFHSKNKEKSQKILFTGKKDKNIASFMLEEVGMDIFQPIGLIFIQSRLTIDKNYFFLF